MKRYARDKGGRFGRNVISLMVVVTLALVSAAALAHNLQTRMVYTFFDPETQACLDARIEGAALPPGCLPLPGDWELGDPLLQVGDELGVIVKVVPRDGTTTGVGGHIDFYVPDGVEVVDVAYVIPDGSGGYEKVAMKGQSPIAIGDGPVGAKATSELIDLTTAECPLGDDLSPACTYINLNGVTADPVVNASGLHRGTIAGLYGDTGIFYSTDPDTAYGSWQRYTEANGGDPTDWNDATPAANRCGSKAFAPTANGRTITNNSGDVVVPCNKWDAEQLYAWGSKGTSFTGTGGFTSPIVDYSDGRGNAPWGFASGVAGPQSGYAWNFDWDEFVSLGGTKTNANVKAAMDSDEIGPWQRIRYDGDRISYDQPGLDSTVLGYANKDAGDIGYVVSSANPLPAGTNAIRWAVGQLTAYRPEYAWVKVRITQDVLDIVDTAGCPQLRADTFGGDAGGTDNGKDHLWRYYEPTEVRMDMCAAVGKPATDDIVESGTVFQYPVKVYNLNKFTLTNVVVKDTLGSGLTLLSAVPSQTSGTNPLVWNVGTLEPGEKFEALVTVRAASSGFLDNCVEVTSTELEPINSCDMTISGPYPFLVPTKTANVDGIAPGGTVIYEVRVLNTGTGPTSSPVSVHEYLPSGFTYDPTYTPTAKINNATVFPTVNASNPNEPVFTINAALKAERELIIRFQAKAAPNIAPGEYCNTYSVIQNGVPITTGSLACVTVGGAKIGDRIWRDWDGDGVQDDDEEGIEGITVELQDGSCTSGVDCPTTVTDENGNYYFTGLSAGEYVVVVNGGTTPAGYTQTGDPDATIDNQHTVTLGTDQEYLTADFGYKPTGTGTIGDTVFEDIGNDGVFNGSDVGIPNVTVWLYEDTDGDGVITAGVDALVATTTSDGSGDYRFENLAEGYDYLVLVDSDDTDIDAYFDGKYGANTPYGLSTAELYSSPNLTGSDLDNDFGFWRVAPASIGDQVFLDANGNGVYDAGTDTPLAGITVWIDSNNDGTIDPGEPTTVSGPDGTYLFDNLGPGTYTVRVDTSDPDVPAGTSASTTSHSVTVAAGEAYLDADFPFVEIFSKTVDKASADPGDALNYTVGISYPGNAQLVNVEVRDPIPSGVTYVADSDDPEATVTPADDTTATLITWDLGSTSVADNGSNNLTGGTAGTISLVGTAPFTVETNSGGGTDADLLLTVPSGIQAGDVMLANIAQRGFSSAADCEAASADASHAQWLLVSGACFETGGKRARATLLYKIASASEPASYTFTLPGGGAAGRIVAFSGVDTAGGVQPDGTGNGPFDVAAGAFEVNSGKSTTLTPPEITTVSDNAAVIMFAMAKNNPAFSNWSTTSPATLNELYDGGWSGADDKEAVAAAWALKPTAGATGDGAVDLSANEQNAGLLVALKPGTNITYNYDTTTAVSADRSLIGASDTLVVTLTLTATGTGVPATISPPSLSVSGTNGADAVFGTPSPSTPQALVSGVPVEFTYTSTSITVGTAPGILTISATPSDTNGNWDTGTANTTIVTPPLTFQATVNNPAGVALVNNVASLYIDSTLTATDDALTAILASIGDFVWVDTNGDGSFDADGADNTFGTADDEYGLAGVRVFEDTNDNGVWDEGEPYDVTDAYGAYRIYGFNAGTYDILIDPTTYPAGYVATTPDSLIITLAAGQQYDLADFGLQPPPPVEEQGSIGDYIWLDADNDGVQDAGEAPLPGISVKLYRDLDGDGVLDPGDPLVATDVTDSGGLYSFTGLPFDDYIVVVDEASAVTSPYDLLGSYTLGGAMAPTYDQDGGTATPDGQTAVTVSSTTPITIVDFGYNWSGSIGDYVWSDTNADGVQDGTETGIDGAAVNLYVDANGDGILNPALGDYQVAFDETTGGGFYSFDNLPPGPYLVDVYEDSMIDDGNRDLVPTTDDVQYVALGAGQTVDTADFGYYQGARIEGNVFHDDDRNAIFDAAEDGLSGITVYLYDCGLNEICGDGDDGSTRTTTTDEDGHFVFLVPEGAYELAYDTAATTAAGFPDATTSLTQSFYAEAGPDWHPVFDFGVDYSGTIGDLVWKDTGVTPNGVKDPEESGIPGVTVYLYLDQNGDGTIDLDGADNIPGNEDDEILVAFTATDENGAYLFEGLADTTGDQEYLVEIPDSNFDSGGPLEGYTQTGAPTEPANSAAEAGPCGDSGYAGCDGDAPATVTGGVGDSTLDFGFSKSGQSVSGTVWNDNGANPGAGGVADDGTQNGDEPGIEGVTVELVKIGIYDGKVDVNGDGIVNGDDDGTYGGIPVIDGYVDYDLDGNVGGAENPGDDTCTDPCKVNGYEVFDGRVDVNGSGSVNDSDDQPTTVVATDITDVNGDYSFLDVQNGDYVIRVDDTTLPSTAFVQTGDPDTTLDNQTSIRVNDAPVTDQDFGYNASFGSISGTVCRGIDGNGICEGGEAVVEGVTVTLTWAGPNGILGDDDDVVVTTTTDVNGDYVFDESTVFDTCTDRDGVPYSPCPLDDGLPPGLYQVTKTNPRGSYALADRDGGFPNNITITLAAGDPPVTGQDFEVAATTAVSIVDFSAYPDSGSVVVRWETDRETGTMGFHLERWDVDNANWLRLNAELLPSLQDQGAGAVYYFVDEGASNGKTYSYRLIERDNQGDESFYGPYEVKVSGKGKKPSGSFEAEASKPHPLTVARFEAAARENQGKGGGGGGGGKPPKGDNTALKLFVGESGLYSVSAADIAGGLGESVDVVTDWIRNSNLLVSHRGEPVAAMAEADNSALLFYGEAIDSYYTDRNVYWIHKAAGLQMGTTSGGSPSASASAGDFPDRVTAEEDVLLRYGIPAEPGEVADRDLWFWSVKAAYGLDNPGVPSAELTVPSPGAVLKAGESACLTAYLKGANDDPAEDPDHQVALRINGYDVGDVEAFDGFTRFELTACFGQDKLVDGDNKVVVVLTTAGDVTTNGVLIDGFELEYRRYYDVEEEDRIWLSGDGNPVVTVEGFSSDEIEILNLADPLQPVRVEDFTIGDTGGGAPYRVSFVPAAPGDEYLVQTVGERLAPLELLPTLPNDLLATNNRADHLVIAPRLLEESAQALVDYRSGTGLSSKLVILEEIYDSFNGGVANPYAIRDFLAYAAANWKQAPAYVALVGKGSLDHKFVRGEPNPLPVLMRSTPHGLFACDSCYTDFDEDGVSEIALGRIPVLSNSELIGEDGDGGYLAKLVRYESFPSGLANQLLFAADDPDIAGEFWDDSDYLAGLVPPRFGVAKAYVGAPPEDDPEGTPLTTGDVHNAIMDGFGHKGLVNWLGHGSYFRLANPAVLTRDDVDALDNWDDMPLFLALTCSAGFFEYPGLESLSEVMLLNEVGGAAAVISPTGESENDDAVMLNEGMLRSLYQDGQSRIGDVLIDAQQFYKAQGGAKPFMFEIYGVMGDPATVIH